MPQRRRGSAYRSLERARERVELVALTGGDVAAAREAFASAAASERIHVDDRVEQNALLDRALDAVSEGLDAALAWAHEHGLGGLEETTSSGGARFIRLKAETFPGHINYAYALTLEGKRVLWDVGTGHGHSRPDLLLALEGAARLFDWPEALSAVDVVMISHGHIDHFGDVGWFVEQTGAALWVHELDARVLEGWEERVIMNGRAMRAWLSRAGVKQAHAETMLAAYMGTRGLYASNGITVDRRLRHRQKLFDGRAQVIHTPGHCPGHICLRVDDVLLVADQVLSPITPHISPQALHPHNGIERYLAGLARLRVQRGVRHVLPAHYLPIPDLGERIDGIARHHAERSQRVASVCAEPATVKEVARAIYGEQAGYNVLLALQEAGAHVEYLHQVGGLRIANLEELQADPDAPVRYQAAAESRVPEVVGSAEGEPVGA